MYKILNSKCKILTTLICVNKCFSSTHSDEIYIFFAPYSRIFSCSFFKSRKSELMMIESFLTSRPVSLLPEAVFIGRPREALNIQTRKACVFCC